MIPSPHEPRRPTGRTGAAAGGDYRPQRPAPVNYLTGSTQTALRHAGNLGPRPEDKTAICQVAHGQVTRSRLASFFIHLIIGAYSADTDPNRRTFDGASYVVLGGTDLGSVVTTIDLATGADLVIQGAAAGHQAGYSVSGAGDVNGDGFDDQIIGAPGAGIYSEGASYVVLGAADLGTVVRTINLATEADLVIQGAAARDNSGMSVSDAGDVSGDGIDDLIIGAYRADPNDRFYAGESYVIFGTDQGFPPVIDLATDADLLVQGAAEVDRSGRSVSGAGDVNDDGIDDLIIGAIRNPNTSAGASYVVFGGPAAATERLIARVEAAGLPGGLENSLIRKLESALGLLDRGNTCGAIGNIGAFIDQVEAQRGKQIDEANADAWIAAAETILDMLDAS